MNTVKQYQNNKGIVMFIDNRKNKNTVSFCDLNGKTINNNDDDALTFFQHEPYLVMEFD